jgi:hypothetical protein
MTTSDDDGGSGAGLLRRLEEASRGLVYSSESDRPFEPYLLPASRVPADPTPAAFAAAVGAPGAPAEEVSLDRFLAPHIEQVEPVDRLAWERLPRYDALKRLLASSLRDVRVFRIGRVEIDCFAVGRDEVGNLVGLRTVAVET